MLFRRSAALQVSLRPCRVPWRFLDRWRVQRDGSSHTHEASDALPLFLIEKDGHGAKKLLVERTKLNMG